MTTTPATLGFRAHTGWAAAVALAGPASSPRLVDRRRLALLPPDAPAHVYHQARELGAEAAARLIETARETARKQAHAGVQAMVAELAAQYRVVGSGIVLGNSRLPGALEAILRSHALVHAAEGELFRQVLLEASAALQLAATGVPARELYAQAAKRLGGSVAQLRRRLGDLGRGAGPPWGQDQKEAALSAWLALLAA